ncbi:MAG: hypothetical protein Q4F83_11160 [Eubacteriales bacterium]|nr:hypothetical protein [Eubacteriales bacterium]
MAFKFRNHVKDNKRLYSIYNGIKKRCYNQNEPRYKDYGGRGIIMCTEWLNDFDVFADWAKENGYEDNLTIERIDVNGNYEPDNCCWITLHRQCFNKRTTKFVIYKGQTKCLMDWCMELNLRYDAIHNRLEKGWSVEEAFETPLLSEEKSLSELAREHGLDPQVFFDRVNKLGWDLNKALNTPIGSVDRSTNEYKEEHFGYMNCVICGKRFLRNSGRQKYCSEKCHSASKKVQYRHVIQGRVI